MLYAAASPTAFPADSFGKIPHVLCEADFKTFQQVQHIQKKKKKPQSGDFQQQDLYRHI